jgi:hydroxyacyl-ACP dehydratase HTD2-like protein with hotdog domain
VLLRQNEFSLSVYKIEHFYSMEQGFSQGKIYSMQYVSIGSQMPDLKSKKPIRMDGLFNLLSVQGSVILFNISLCVEDVFATDVVIEKSVERSNSLLFFTVHQVSLTQQVVCLVALIEVRVFFKDSC